jgi:hypothetical protein
VSWTEVPLLDKDSKPLKTRDYWVFGRCLSSGILKNTTFRKLVLCASIGPVVEISYF